ncbi:MAG: sigma-70 family RNA polymerase sigma factor [Planctomycetota bacterium]|nr:sigma-70 family RNA polymerase sigma factor [Planctomycetota bacterium]
MRGYHETVETRATLLQRLKADGSVKEVAWSEFYALYGPIIARFARSRGVRPEEIDELVQDVVSGFFAAQPRFVYDPTKGRFRGYLMACVSNTIRSRLRREACTPPTPSVAASEPVTSDQTDWDAAWKQAALDAAVTRLREKYSDNPTFQAFEAVVIRGQSPDVVATSLGLSRDSVYQAKTRLLAKLRIELDAVEQSLEPND